MEIRSCETEELRFSAASIAGSLPTRTRLTSENSAATSSAAGTTTFGPWSPPIASRAIVWREPTRSAVSRSGPRSPSFPGSIRRGSNGDGDGFLRSSAQSTLPGHAERHEPGAFHAWTAIFCSAEPPCRFSCWSVTGRRLDDQARRPVAPNQFDRSRPRCERNASRAVNGLVRRNAGCSPASRIGGGSHDPYAWAGEFGNASSNSSSITDSRSSRPPEQTTASSPLASSCSLPITRDSNPVSMRHSSSSRHRWQISGNIPSTRPRILGRPEASRVNSIRYAIALGVLAATSRSRGISTGSTRPERHACREASSSTSRNRRVLADSRISHQTPVADLAASSAPRIVKSPCFPCQNV